MVNPLHNHLNVTICQNAADAIAQGFNYAAQGDKYKPIQIEQVVVVRDGTEAGRSTVDLVLKDENGQLYVAMLTGRLIKSIPC